MYKKRALLTLSLIFFISGIFFILNYNSNVTGTAFGITSNVNPMLGFILIMVSTVLFFGGISTSAEEVSIKYDSSLDEKEVSKRLNTLVINLKKDYKGKFNNFKTSWNNNNLKFSFNTHVCEFKGNLIVESNKVVLEYSLPVTAMFFKGKIINTLKKQIKIALAS